MSNSLEKIGEGYYYAAYALSKTRVLKKHTSYASKLKKLCTWYGRNPTLLLRKIFHLRKTAEEVIERSRELAGIPELQELLGNPRFINKHEYEQDRGILLDTLLICGDESSFMASVRQYLDANLLLWEFGYADVVHNFTLNAGVSTIHRGIIFMDFNEFTRNKEGVARDIRTQKWLRQLSMRNLEKSHPALHVLVAELFATTFTLAALDERWSARRNADV